MGFAADGCPSPRQRCCPTRSRSLRWLGVRRLQSVVPGGVALAGFGCELSRGWRARGCKALLRSLSILPSLPLELGKGAESLTHPAVCGRAGQKPPYSPYQGALGRAPAPRDAGLAPSLGSGQVSADTAPQQHQDPGGGFTLALGQSSPMTWRGPHPTPGDRREEAL